MFKQPLVLRTFRRGFTDHSGFSVDEIATEKNCVTLLEKSEVKKIGNYYPISISSVGGRYENSKQYRVYFSEDFQKKAFIQSDKEGNIDIEKLITKTTEYVEIGQNRVDKKNAKEKQEKADDAYCDRLNKKLLRTGFKVTNSGSGFEITKFVFRAEIDSVVASLLK
jgi:hypothetical protein